MRRARRALGPIAAAWLLCQAATLTLIPVLTWTDAGTASAACTCTHGTDALCPMHHRTAAGVRTCAFQDTTTNTTTTLGSLFPAPGLLPGLAHSTAPAMP